MHDVIVVGGSYAGISAALQIARGRRGVLVVDAGERRNRFAARAHGFLGHDGDDPAALQAAGKAQLLAYPTVTWRAGRAVRAAAATDGFALALESGEQLAARRLVLATGVVDELPAIPGLAERWGRSVFHCPYCHGYELGGGPVAVIATSPVSVHSALLLPDWGPTTYVTRDIEPTADELAALARRGVRVERTPIAAIEGAADVRLATGEVAAFAGLFVAPAMRISPLAAQLGCALDQTPLGALVKTDLTRETTVRGVFACGDTIIGGNVASAVGDGARAGAAAHRSLALR